MARWWWVFCVSVVWLSSHGGRAEDDSGYFMREHSLAAPYQGKDRIPTANSVNTSHGAQVRVWISLTGSLVGRLW